MTYTIAEPCIDVKDRACVDECPVDCIYEGPRMLYIHPDECVDCGACEPVCPVTAIFYEDDVPAEWKQFTPINAEFFNENISGLGSPGGAAQVGPAGGRPPDRRRLGRRLGLPRSAGCRGGAGRRQLGRNTRNEAPPPDRSSTHARPPCRSAKRATRVRPTPTPGECVGASGP